MTDTSTITVRRPDPEGDEDVVLVHHMGLVVDEARIPLADLKGVDRRLALVSTDAHHSVDVRLVQEELEHVDTEYAVSSDDGDPSETSCHVTSPIRMSLVLAGEDDGL